MGQQIIAFGQNARPSLGISVMPDADRERFGRSLGRKLEGAVVAGVVKGSPADELRLKPTKSQLNGILLGDMITAVNGAPVKTNEDLLCAVEELEVTPVQRRSLTYEQ